MEIQSPARSSVAIEPEPQHLPLGIAMKNLVKVLSSY